MINGGSKTTQFTKISQQHIRDAIDKTITSKGFGNKNISSYFLKLPLPYIINSLVCMSNKFLEKRELPAF